MKGNVFAGIYSEDKKIVIISLFTRFTDFKCRTLHKGFAYYVTENQIYFMQNIAIFSNKKLYNSMKRLAVFLIINDKQILQKMSKLALLKNVA